MARAPLVGVRTMRAKQLLQCVCLLIGLGGCAASSAPQPDAAQPELQPSPQAGQAAPPAQAMNLRVDHAWVKDSESADEQGMQQRAMKQLREKIVAGGSFVASWNELGVDGTNWHVAEQESYPIDVMPEAVR